MMSVVHIDCWLPSGVCCRLWNMDPCGMCKDGCVVLHSTTRSTVDVYVEVMVYVDMLVTFVEYNTIQYNTVNLSSCIILHVGKPTMRRRRGHPVCVCVAPAWVG